MSLIKEWEGYRDKAYLDTGGVWTIGWGHTKGVKQGDVCTLKQAEQWYLEDTEHARNGVETLVKVPLTDEMREALESFTYNCGVGALASSTLLRKLNALDYEGAAQQFKRWNKDNGKVILGLTRRRAAEEALFRRDMDEIVNA